MARCVSTVPDQPIVFKYICRRDLLAEDSATGALSEVLVCCLADTRILGSLVITITETPDFYRVTATRPAPPEQSGM